MRAGISDPRSLFQSHFLYRGCRYPAKGFRYDRYNICRVCGWVWNLWSRVPDRVPVIGNSDARHFERAGRAANGRGRHTRCVRNIKKFMNTVHMGSLSYHLSIKRYSCLVIVTRYLSNLITSLSYDHISSCCILPMIYHFKPPSTIIPTLPSRHPSSFLFPGILSAANEAILSQSCVEKVSEYCRPWILEKEDLVSQRAQNENQLVCLCVPITTPRDLGHSDGDIDGYNDGGGDNGRSNGENCCFVFVKHLTHDDIRKKEDKETDDNRNSPQGDSEGEKNLFSPSERGVLFAAVAIACRSSSSSSSSSHSQNTHRPGILNQGKDFNFFSQLDIFHLFLSHRTIILFYPPSPAPIRSTLSLDLQEFLLSKEFPKNLLKNIYQETTL